MSPPNKVSRRGFLGLFREDASGQAPAADVPADAPQPVVAPRAQGFSLEAFYAARVPATELHVTLAANLPRVETTRVGVPDLVPALGPPAASCPTAELATASGNCRKETKP